MKVIIATDGSSFSLAAAQEACRLFGRMKETEFTIVAVFEDVPIAATEPFALPPEYYQEMTDAARSQAKHNAEQTAEALRSGCPDANVTVEVLSGKPASQIVDLAERIGAQTIVVGSHGRGFWGRLLGSVSNSVVNHAPCSVLVVRSEPAGNK